jgi:hypothetical protein
MQALESIMDFFKCRDYLRLHFGHKWLTHLGVLQMGSKDFVTCFLNEFLF